jgi:hypothetical protein
MASELDDMKLDDTGFAYRDIRGQDRWTLWTPVFTSLTVVGATAYSARYRTLGKMCQFQAKISAATSIASVAGTTYVALPLSAMGLSGMSVMTNATTNVAVGLGHIDVTNSRMYLPAQLASGNIFHLFGQYEV